MSRHSFTIPPSSAIEVTGGGNALNFTVLALNNGLPVTLLRSGVAGKSAYQTAVDNGFIGTEAAWLASLHGAIYEHQQPSASTTWTINHNFGRHVSVAIYSTGGSSIIGQITNINTNQSLATFDGPMAGYAIAS